MSFACSTGPTAGAELRRHALRLLLSLKAFAGVEVPGATGDGRCQMLDVSALGALAGPSPGLFVSLLAERPLMSRATRELKAEGTEELDGSSGATSPGGILAAAPSSPVGFCSLPP